MSLSLSLSHIQVSHARFGCGYKLQVHCNADTQAAVIEFVARELPSATLRETRYNQAQFQLQQNSFKLANVFRAMEKARRLHLVQDYSISQTTLEEVRPDRHSCTLL
jgi:ATP-binding cassette, subfamily A (ABC1), member 7